MRVSYFSDSRMASTFSLHVDGPYNKHLTVNISTTVALYNEEILSAGSRLGSNPGAPSHIR
jgi:hypothetical protein